MSVLELGRQERFVVVTSVVQDIASPIPLVIEATFRQFSADIIS